MQRLFFLLLLLPAGVLGQSLFQRSEVGLCGGGMTYIGDLNDQSMFGRPNLAGGLLVRANIDTRWAVAAGGSYGHIEGGNPDCVRLRNLSFRSSLWEAFLRAEFNFLPYGLRRGVQKRFSPFIFGGVGIFGFNPRAAYTSPTTGATEWYDLQPLGTEGQGTSAYPDRRRYSLLELCVPFGVGIKWRLSPGLHLCAEYGWRLTRTDYLDDVSTTYVDPQLLIDTYGEGSMAARLADRSGEVQEGYVNAPGVKRGDDSLNDWYAFFHISLTISAEVLFGWMRGRRCDL